MTFTEFMTYNHFFQAMVEAKEEIPSTPQAVNGEPVNWADLVDYEEKASSKTTTGPVITSAPSLKPNEQNVHVEYSNNGDRIETEYRINPDTNKKEKVIFRLTLLSLVVLKRGYSKENSLK